MRSQGEEVGRMIAERNNLMQRLQDCGIGVIHSRVHGTQMSVATRNGRQLEPFSTERAKQLLADREEPSSIDIANARMR